MKITREIWEELHRKALWRGFAVSILWGALLILAAFIMAGCGTTLYDRQSGRRLAVFRSDIIDLNYWDGATGITASKLNNSRPTSAALLGANRIVGTVSSAAVGVLVPGSSSASTIGRAAIVTVPHLASPVAKPGD